jgi:hypothetical protein
MPSEAAHRAAHTTASGLRPLWADLHVHTVVSPCAEVEMIPPLIVQRARELGLGLIAITDHNTGENVEAVQQAAQGSGLVVLPGMEVQTREEVHVLCLFDTLDALLDWQEQVYASLPPLKNREDVFGAQFVVDESGEFVRMNERLLLTSASLSIDEVVSAVARLGGLTIAAHVNRPAYSLITNLGMIPPGLALSALEISRHVTPEEAIARLPQIAGWPLIRSGDAHQLSEMCASTLIAMREPSIAELAMAFRQEGGRRVKVLV